MKTIFSNQKMNNLNMNKISRKILMMFFSLSVFFILFSLNSCEDNSVKDEPVIYNYEGVLSDKDNNPIPNAIVNVYSNANYTLNSETLISSSTTDESGLYKIENIKNNMSSYKVKVTHSEYKNIELPLLEFAKNINDGKIPSKLENNENCCGLINVTITDENNLPLDMAKVKFFREGKNTRVSKSNELGIAKIENICEGNFGITIQKEGYKAKEENFEIKGCDPVNINVILQSNNNPVDTCCKGKVKFGVKDQNGNLIEGANVKFRQSGVVKKDGKTNGDGFITLEGLCEGKYSVLVSLDGFKSTEVEVEVKCDETIEVTKTIEEDGCCKGIIKFYVKDQNGIFYKNAYIKFKIGGTVKAEGKTNDNGFAGFDGLCEGTYLVYVTLDGFKNLETEVEVKCNETIEATRIVEKNSTDCCKGIAELVIKDKDGNKVPNASIKFRQSGVVKVDGKTNGDGYLKLENLCEGTYSVLVSLDGYKSIEFEFVVKCNQTTETSKIIEKNSTDCCKGNVVVWVKNNQNEFIENANVYIKKNGIITNQGKTNSVGKLVIEAICEGEYTLVILKDGYKNLESTIVVKCNETIEATRIITEEVACCKGRVIFSMVDADGKPVPNAKIKIWANGVVVKELKTNVEGLAIDSLCEGNYEANFSAEGYKSMEGQFVVKCEETLPFSKVFIKNNDCCKGIAELVIKDKDGNKVPNASIKFRQSGVVKVDGKTNGDGYLKLENLCEGTYSVLVSLDGYKSIEFEFVVKCNQTTETSKIIEKNSTDCCKGIAELVIKDKDGNKVPNASIKFRQSGVVKADGKTNGDGYLKLENLCEGTYSVLVSLDGYKSIEFEFVVKCNQTTETSKIIEKNTVDCCNNFIDITVKDKNSGDKIENAFVYIYLNGKLVKELKTNVNGRIELGDRCKGNYKIKIMKDGYITEYKEFAFDCGETETLVFELSK